MARSARAPAAASRSVGRRWRHWGGAAGGGLGLALAAIALWEGSPADWPQGWRWAVGALAGVIGGLLLGRRRHRSAGGLLPQAPAPVAAPSQPPEGTRPEAELSAGLLALSTDAVLVLDAQGRLLRLTEPDGRQRLRALAECSGQPLWALCAAGVAPQDLQALRRALKQGQPWRDLAWRWRDVEGGDARFLLSGLPQHAPDGQLRGFGAVLRAQQPPAPAPASPSSAAAASAAPVARLAADPAASALAHAPARLLSESELELTRPIPPQRPDEPGALFASGVPVRALLMQLLNTSPDAIALTELASGRFLMVNNSFERIFGYRAQDVLGQSSLELGIWAQARDREQLQQALRLLPLVQSLPATFKTRDGQLLEVLLSASRFRTQGRDYLVIQTHDITEAEQTRLEYQVLMDNALIGIALTHSEHFLTVNARFEAMLGWPAGALVGQHVGAVWPSARELEEANQLFRPRLMAGEAIDVEHRLKRRDGSAFLCRLQAKVVNPTHPTRGGVLWLAEDVTDRRQVELALGKARDDAEAANRAKSDFLANLSHEIRTPLNALLGLARLARQPEVDERRRRHYIEQISDSAETLSAIITDILDLSKIEAGKMHLEHLPFTLRELLHHLLQAYGALADNKGLAMRLVCDPDVPDVVIGDSVRLRQILSNYLTNALKFTDAGEIELTVHRARGPVLRFEVRDTGAGIDAQAQQRLFKPFTQVDNSVNRRFGGTGLGLSICRQLAQLMEGEVGVLSQPGQGSTFWAELPLPSGTVEDLDTSTGSDGLDPINGARVLMVEDNPVNMMIAVALLEQWGALVTQAHDGAQAIEAVEQAHGLGRPFDVVLMDVQMPGISGHEATRMLRRRYSRERLPIIALTAAALVSERNQALAEGMNDFLTKPIDAQRLRASLVRALRALHGGR